MIAQQTFRAVIDAQQNITHQKEIGIERELIDKIPISSGFASIITGIRRCGKCTLQLQLKNKYYPNDGLFINFEDPRLAGMDTQDFERLHAEIEIRKTKVLFFDEIQVVKGWELYVNQLLREDFFVFVTGSNASLLSKELGTHLTGRHFSTELFPFSYKEFLVYKKIQKDIDKEKKQAIEPN